MRSTHINYTEIYKREPETFLIIMDNKNETEKQSIMASITKKLREDYISLMNNINNIQL